LQAAFEQMLADEIIGSRATTLPAFERVVDRLLARRHGRQQLPRSPTGCTNASGWEQARRELERAIGRYGRDQRQAALRDLADSDSRLVTFVERVRWAVLCEQPMRFSERRYRELWSEITDSTSKTQTNGGRRMTTATERRRATVAVAPHNLEAERSVLGAILLSPAWLTGITLDVGLSSEDFYRAWHGHAFAAMCTLHDAGEPIDHLTVSEVMRHRGHLGDDLEPGRVEELAAWVPAAGHAVRYGQIVRDHAQLRRLLAATYEIQAIVTSCDDSVSEILDAAERRIFKLRRDALRAHQRRLEDAVSDELDRLHQATIDEREIPGLSTGLRPLDRLLGGLQDGRMYVVAARPSMGKSLLCLQVARHVATRERAECCSHRLR
jgi:DnaB-like helicase N terminal domain/DnaB-like helicase C terminal domain